MNIVYYYNVKHNVNSYYDIEWHKLHRDGDLPAIILDDRTQMWYKNGLCHRDSLIGADRVHRDLPSIIWNNGGTREWYRNGLKHRDGDLPAVIWTDGTQQWYKNGKRHRDSLIGNKGVRYDLPAIIWAYGPQEWFKNDIKQKDGYKVSKYFNLYTFLSLQFIFRFLYIFRYNKQIWSPSNLAGIHTKNSLMKLFSMKREKN